MKKYKLTLYMSGGAKVTILCNDFDISKLSGQKTRSISITEPDRVWSVDVDKIEAWTAVPIWRFLWPIYSLY